MPKHLPTFKHLLHSSQQPIPKPEKDIKSVNDLIQSSRNSRPIIPTREIPSHLNNGTTNDRERVWSPSPIASSSSNSILGGLNDIEFSGIHPAELLRRSNLEQRQASRSVAGPAPPPSWRPSTSTNSISTKPLQSVKSSIHPISTNQLGSSSDLFSANSVNDINRKKTLVEYCFKTVLRYLEDEEEIQIAIDDLDETSEQTEVYTLGGLLREQIPYLSTHLKSSLIQNASFLPSNYPYRLSDKSLLSILSDPPLDPDPEESHDLRRLPFDSSNDWDNPISEPTITHLPLMIHPSPQLILPRIPSLNSITSLNLAYSTLPVDLDKLVAVLPSGLRELSLVGVKFGGKGVGDEDALKRGFGGLGRRLIVLRMLDLSFLRFELTPKILEGLLNPGNVKLPSLRILGLRGYARVDENANNGEESMNGVDECQDVKENDEDHMKARKKEVIDLLKNSGRSKYVDVVW